VTERHVVAMGGGGFSMDDGGLDAYVLDLVSAPRPKVCLVPTATSSVPAYVTRFLEAFPASSFEPSFLELFDRTVADVDAFLGEQDVIYVGGGNTANMLAVWRVHGVDRALRAAWASGVVLCGVSAGANCWFEASTTNSFLLGRADALTDGLALLPGSFCPHYHGEPERRPSFHALIASGVLPPGLACDDYAAVHLVGTELHAAVASRAGARAFRVTRLADAEHDGDDGARVEEEALEMRLLRAGGS
jgi:peptidase E